MRKRGIYKYLEAALLSFQLLTMSRCQLSYKSLDIKSEVYVEESSPLKYDGINSLTNCGLLARVTDSVLFTFDEERNTCLIHNTNGNLTINLYPKESNMFAVSGRIQEICPNATWKSFNNKCFLFSSNQLPWEDAKEECQTMNAHLARIEDNETNAFIKGFVSVGSNSYYLGGNDIDKEDRWVWEDNGALLTFTDWKPGNPNNFNRVHGQDCLLMQVAVAESWNDLPCYQSKRYICETVKYIKLL